jgi:hypothetical protein
MLKNYFNSSTSGVLEGYHAKYNLHTNLAFGTSVPYIITGISPADVEGGALSGNAIVDLNGIASFTIKLVDDALTEGREAMIVSAGGVNNLTIIYDGTASMPLLYGVTKNGVSWDEGSTANISWSTTNLASGTLIPYTLSGAGITENDVSSGSLNGTAVVDSKGIATISLGILKDNEIEDNEVLTISAGDAIFDILINAPTYLLSLFSSSNSVNNSFDEGSDITFVMKTTGLPSGFSLNYTMYGTVSAFDFKQGIDYGNWTIDSSGTAMLTVGLLADSQTEGPESFTFRSGGSVPLNVTVIDTSKGTTSSTYSVVASNSSVNEGSTATFTLTTTNVSAGTLVPYTVLGINAADISSGSLSGITTVSSNGQATINVLLANDNLTEGTETLTVTAGGASASVQINDTSKSTSPTYSISTNWTSTTEGTPIVATLTTTNVTSGTTLYYQLSGSGITINDFSGLPLTGSSVVNSLGQASLTIPLALDTTTEGDETFSIQYFTDPGRTVVAGSAALVIIRDTSKDAVTPTYTVAANNSSVNEGSAASFTISTLNLAVGSSVAYTLSGVSSSDITGGSLSGVAIINSSGTATVSVPIASDNLTEGTETLTISLQGKTASTVINDTSKAAVTPTYSLVAESSSVNEGSIATFNLITTNVAAGTTISYTLSGVSASDVTGGLSGTATLDANGLAAISVPMASDFLTEGTETLTVASQGKTASVVVNDTSKTALIASYALSASSISVSEGSSAVFTLTTVNVPGGTAVAYTVTGVSASDITGGALSGTAIVSASGSATISIPIAADLFTEGSETLTVTAQQVSSSAVISDSSITPNSVTPVSTEAPFIPYGSGRFFVQTSGADKATGTAFIDFFKQASNYDANQIVKLSDGHWQIQNKANPTNTDTLVNVERVNFNDVSLALDVSGPAGQVAKILGALFGSAAVKNSSYAGIGLAYIDSGMSYQGLANLAADAAGLNSPDAVVSTLWKNVVGFTASQSDKAPFIKLLNDGMSVGELVTLAADSSLNALSISLTDLSTTGLLFSPYSIPVVPTYALSAQSSVSEGESASLYLSTTNVPVGTLHDYVISGISQSDLVGSLSGKVIVDASGKAVINLITIADSMTEGPETMTISLNSATAQVVIKDTSITLVGIIDDGGGGGGGGGGGAGGGGGGGGGD